MSPATGMQIFTSEPPRKCYGPITLSNYSRKSNIFEILVRTGCNLYTSFLYCVISGLICDCHETKYGYDWISFIRESSHGESKGPETYFKNINRLTRRHLLLTYPLARISVYIVQSMRIGAFWRWRAWGRFNTVCVYILSRKHDVVCLWGVLVFLWISFPGDHKTFILHVYTAGFWKTPQLPKLSWG